MAKTLLRNNSQSPITLPPPYTGIIAPGDAVVLDDPPSVVSDVLGIVPELITFLVVTQVPDAQPVDGHDRAEAAAQIAGALASLTEPLDLNGQKIVNVADPTNPQDAATKAYVDAHGGGGGGGSVTNVSSTNAYLTVANGTTTPQLTVNVGTGATDVAAGVDSRFNAAPSTAGAVVYDSGSAYTKTPAGSVGQVLKVGAGGLPEWGSDSTTPSGPAGGSLAGNYPSPTIAAGAISNAEVSATAAIATSKLSGALTDITGNGLATFVDAATLPARTYYVAVNGNDANDGSLSAPFATIQAAHDEAASVYSAGEYVAIEVGPGTFTGNINITRKNTLIQGQGHRAEMFATTIAGSITVNPLTATSKFGDMVGIAGCFVSVPSASTAPAVKATGSAIYSLILNDCYLYTNNAASTASAIACDATNALRPRILVNDGILATEKAGPAIAQFDRGDVRINNTRVQHNSGVTLGAAGDGVAVLNNATLWLNSSTVETRTRGSAVVATGAAAETKLLSTIAGITCAYAGPENTTHGVTVGNTSGAAAFLFQTTFSVADVSAGVYAINGSAPAVVVYGELSFQVGTNTAIAPAVTLTAMTETHANMVLPALTASLPLKLDANKQVTAAAITLSGSEVTGTLPIGKGGTGIATAPTAGGVVYGGATTQAYSAAGSSGQPLLSGGSGAPSFGSLDLGVAANITGTLPTGNQAAQSFGTGDVSGSTASATVVGLQGRPLAATAPTAGQVVAWSGSSWEPATVTAGGGGGGGSGGLTYYMNYSITPTGTLPAVGDKQLALDYDTVNPQSNTGAVVAPQGTYATLAEFVTDLGLPGATTIPPGNWDVAAYLILSTGSNNTFMRARVFKWDGTTLTELSTSPSDDVAITASALPELVTASVYIQQAVLTASDRIVVRLEITRTIATSRSVTGYFGGNTPSHAHTTLGAPGGTGLIKVVDGVVQAPASLLVNADVDAAAAIDITKLDGNAGVGGANKVLHGSATAGVAPTWSEVALGSDVSGQLPVANGGTGLSSGTQGGVPFFSTTGAMSSSSALTANALVLGGGASGPSTLGSLGTTTTVLHGNATGAPTWGAISLTNDVSGTLPIASGGTNGSATPTAGEVAYGDGTSYAFTTGSTAGKLLQSNGISPPSWLDIVPYTAGGTGTDAIPTANQVPYGNLTSTGLTYTSGGSVGEVLGIGAGGQPQWISNGSSPTGAAGNDLSGNYPDPTVAKINGTTISTAGGSLTTGTVLRATGASSADWGALDLGNANAVSGTLPTARLPASIIYDTGTYANPSWLTSLAGSKISGNISGNADNVTGTVAVANGGTGVTSVTTHGVVYGASATAYAATAAGLTGTVLKGVTGSAPSFAAVNLTSDVGSSVLPIGNGGTGADTLPLGDANKVFASPDTAAGAPSFRSLVAADIPSLPASKITSIPYDVAGSVAGLPNAGATVFFFKATRAFTLSATSGDHSFAANIGATDSAVFTVYRNADQIFQATFAAGGSSPQSASIGAVTNNSISVGDVITVVAPASQDATLADVYWTLTGTL